MTTRAILRQALTGAGALLVVATGLSFVPSNEWWIRVFDFPRRQIGVLLLAIVPVALVALDLRRWSSRVFLGATLLALAAQLFRVLPYTRAAHPQVASSPSCEADARLRLVVANVEYSNGNSERLLALIQEIEPDLALLLEPGAWWESQLRPLEDEMPYVLRRPQEDTWGMLLYSRLELHDSEIRFLVEPDIPSIRTTVRIGSGHDVRLFAVHPRPPRPGDDTDERDSELTTVAREIRARDHPAILAGDLNDVAWSRTTRRVQEIAGVLDPRVGRGVFSTFSADLPPGLRWPLDHVFVTPHFDLCHIDTLPDIGSDHLPLLVEVVLRESGRQR